MGSSRHSNSNGTNIWRFLFSFLIAFAQLVQSHTTCVSASKDNYECTGGSTVIETLRHLHGEKQVNEWLKIGVTQRVEGSDLEKENVMAVLIKMDHYILNEVLTQPQYERVRGKW